jgi:hypothetical protein
VRIRLRRAIATSTICATTVLSTVLVPPTATSANPSTATVAKQAMSRFGYNAVASGSVVRSNNVDVCTGRTALVTQACTRLTGTAKTAETALATPDNNYIDISSITSTSNTYRNAATNTYGARATSTIGDVSIGGAGFGVLKVKGLTVVADAFHKPAGYGTIAGLDFAKISLTLPAGTPIDGPLADLLDAINNQVVDQIVKVLEQNGTIDIPGFGTIGLAETWRQKGNCFASAWAHGLVIRFTGDGTDTEVLLGQAHTRIGGPAPLATFRSNLQAMDVQALDGLVHLSRVGATNIPCEGSGGNVAHVTRTSASAVPVGQLIQLGGIDNSYAGNQFSATGRVHGWVNTHIDTATIKGVPSVSPELVFTDIDAKVTVTRKSGQPVATGITTKVGGFTVNGTQHALPKPGQVLVLKNGADQAAATVETRIVDRGTLGAHVQAVRVTLLQKNIVIYLGWAYNSVWPN